MIDTFHIAGPVLITPKIFRDERGYFCETFRSDAFVSAAGPYTFVQDNQSFSVSKGTVRGLHLQKQPHAQGKLVRVVQGAIFDVAVDVRPGSPTYGQTVSAELTADNARQLWIPPGFLHGFCTLTDDTMVAYKVTAYYNAEADVSVRWDDADIGIAWPSFANPAYLSRKDASAIPLRNLGELV